MFAYVVKRLISGVLVVTLVSMGIFLLFWYGPSSPAQPICDRETSNRCTSERLEVYEETLGYNNPVYEEYGKFVKGIFVGRTLTIASNEYECGAPCLGVNIRTAKAKGLRSRTVVYKHGLRAALVPVVTIFGIDFGTLLAGTIFTERIFEIQGIGWWSLEAVQGRDLPVVMATALFSAVILILANLIVDVIYSVLDPRVRLS